MAWIPTKGMYIIRCILTFEVHSCMWYFHFPSQRKNIMDGHTSRIFACAFNPKSHHELISGGWDNTVMFWDDRQPYATRYLFGVHMCGEGLDFDKPGKTVCIFPSLLSYCVPFSLSWRQAF